MAGDWDVVSQEDIPQPSTAAPTAAPAASPGNWSVASEHPLAGPTGNLAVDFARRLGTAAIDAGTGLISPLLNRKSALGVDPTSGTVTRGPTPDVDTARSNAFNTLGATEYQPATLGGRLGQAALTGAVTGVLDPATIPAMVGGSVTSELAAELAPSHPFLARLLGFLPGAALGRGISNLPLRPGGGTMDPVQADLAQTATGTYGIPLAPGQLTDNPFIRYFYSQSGRLPFSGAERYAGTQQAALNRGIAETFGENADRITPDVIGNAYTHLGDRFDNIAARTTINSAASGQMLNEFARIERNAPLVMQSGEWAPIKGQLDEVLNKVQPGDTISGDAYQALTRRNSPLDLAQRSTNPNISYWGNQIRNALDDALEASAAPGDVDALRTTRAQWKALKTVEPLTVRADPVGQVGARPTSGDISPAALRAAVNQSYGIPRVARAQLGDIPLNDLAKIGQRFLKEPQDSSTASRELANRAIESFGPAALLAGVHEAGVPLVTSLAGTAGTLAANRLAQGLLRSPMIARRMIAAGQNPNGFAFTSPSMLQQAPILSMPPQPMPLALPGPATSAN